MIDHFIIMFYGPEEVVRKRLLTDNNLFFSHVKEFLVEFQLMAEDRLVPLFRGVTAVVILIYIMTLIFSYDELFGATKEDELIKLTEKEINEIRKKVEDSRF